MSQDYINSWEFFGMRLSQTDRERDLWSIIVFEIEAEDHMGREYHIVLGTAVEFSAKLFPNTEGFEVTDYKLISNVAIAKQNTVRMSEMNFSQVKSIQNVLRTYRELSLI